MSPATVRRRRRKAVAKAKKRNVKGYNRDDSASDNIIVRTKREYKKIS